MSTGENALCVECGSELPGRVEFCPKCGAGQRSMPQAQIQCAPAMCGRCDGHGWTSRETICPGCGGPGSVLVAQPATKCGRCAGNGWTNRETICPGCGGSGWAHTYRPPQK